MINEVLLDMDGVLVNWVKAAGQLYGVDLYADRANRGKWQCNEFVGLNYDEFSRPMDLKFWTNLEWMPDGRTILAILEDQFGKENICLLSDPRGCVNAMEGKLRWIKQHMPGYEKRYLFGPAKFFAGAENRILVDDYDKNIDEFTQRRLPSLQVPRLWNRLHFIEPVEYVKDVLECLNQPNPMKPK